MKPNKKVIFIIISIFCLISLAALLIFVRSKKQSEEFVKKTTFVIEVSTGEKISPSISKIISEINTGKTEKIKYASLKKLSEYLFSVYGLNHDPEIRAFVNTDLNNFALKIFSNEYKEEDFQISCADPSCGNQLENEMKNIISEINSDSTIPSEYKRVITRNLTSATYISDEDMDAKVAGFTLATKQLNRLNEPSASRSAQKIIKYFSNKNNILLKP